MNTKKPLHWPWPRLAWGIFKQNVSVRVCVWWLHLRTEIQQRSIATSAVIIILTWRNMWMYHVFTDLEAGTHGSIGWSRWGAVFMSYSELFLIQFWAMLLINAHGKCQATSKGSWPSRQMKEKQSISNTLIRRDSVAKRCCREVVIFGTKDDVIRIFTRTNVCYCLQKQDLKLRLVCNKKMHLKHRKTHLFSP